MTMLGTISLACALLPSACFAQWEYRGVAVFTWSTSTDAGTTWHDGDVTVPQSQTSVLVRASASWRDAGFGFRAAGFDAIVEGLNGAGPTDTASSFRLFPTFNPSPVQATRFGPVLKIDHSGDLLPPGQGTGGIIAFQPPDQFGTNFSTMNPLWLFEFELVLDGSTGRRRIGEAFLAPQPGGNNTDRVLAIWTAWQPQLTYSYPLTTSRDAYVTVVPTPATLFLNLALISRSRRRRTRA